MAKELIGTVISDSPPGTRLHVEYDDPKDGRALLDPPDFPPPMEGPHAGKFPHVVPRGYRVEVMRGKIVNYWHPDEERKGGK